LGASSDATADDNIPGLGTQMTFARRAASCCISESAALVADLQAALPDEWFLSTLHRSSRALQAVATDADWPGGALRRARQCM